MSKEVNEERTPRTVEDVKEMLTKHSNGEIQRTIQNCITILQNDHVLADAIRLNLLSERIDIVKPVGWSRSGKTLNDTDMKYILRRMEKYGISSEKKIESAIRIVANENRYHPIRDYLNSLKWDGTERIAHVLHHFLGAAEDEYTCEAMKIFLLGAIKRVFQPGCKFETMLCLVGGQGAGKSTFFRLLAVKDEWFSDDLRRLDDDNVYRKLQGHWTDGWGEAAPLTGLLYCADCGGKMYVHRTNNGKRISQYTCSQYSKVPVGKLCTTQHRINEDVVLSLVSEMLKAIAEYAKHDRAEFVRVVQEAQSSQQTAEVKKQRTRLATAKQRVSELEVLLCKIYEDNILGKLSDSRYATLDAQYEKEQSELTVEISDLEKAIKSYEKHEKDADRFIALIDKYENFDKLTIAMLNEFIEKILVHERDRKGSIQTTQEVEIYFNFVGRFVPPAFGEVELTPEELEEIRKREERKDRLHQNYLKRKANGKQKEYEERTKAKKKAEIEARKQAIRTEDIARGVFIPVSSLPQLGPRKGA